MAHQLNSPTPWEIVQLAIRKGYRQRRSEVSSTLFFEQEHPSPSMPPVLVNVYYTTRSVMTLLDHPVRGSNQLWRSNAYQDLDELESILENPRLHTNKGYRTKNEACRGCTGCGNFKQRNEFSDNQWRKGPDANKCRECVLNSKELGDALEEEEYPSLTTDVLQEHDKTIGDYDTGKKERRQFNCPDCPRHGRGKFVFFKKVPVYKPLVKCPKCKRVTHGNCQRLSPVPKDKEKGYGFFKCNMCHSTWGSSRAVASIGQECQSCASNRNNNGSQEPVWVKPFRIEVVRGKASNNWGGILGGGPKKARRVPKEPINEDEEAVPAYTSSDQARHVTGASNALVGGGSGSGGNETDSFDLVNEEEKHELGSRQERPSSGYRHHCQGCSTGICKSRFLPKSKRHENSDGDTISTSLSVVTNSSVGKDAFVDRDQDFADYDDYSFCEQENGSSSWQQV